MVARRPWWVRCARVTKPQVGDLHFHRMLWSPWRVSSVWYQPPQRTVTYRVPQAVTESVMAAESMEQAMVLLRHVPPGPRCD